jgi:hypothetical protein
VYVYVSTSLHTPILYMCMYMCPHPYILLYMCPRISRDLLAEYVRRLGVIRHTTVYVYYYICVLHAPIYVSSCIIYLGITWQERVWILGATCRSAYAQSMRDTYAYAQSMRTHILIRRVAEHVSSYSTSLARSCPLSPLSLFSLLTLSRTEGVRRLGHVAEHVAVRPGTGGLIHTT